MSTTRDAATSQPASAPPRSWFRRFWFPCLVLAACAGIVMSPQIGTALGFDMDDAMPLLMMRPPALLLGLLLLALWWLFFSGLTWRVRLGGVGLAGVLVAGFVFSIRTFELTSTSTGLAPIFHFKWESSDYDRYLKYQDMHPTKADALAAPDATIGPEDFPSYRGPNRDGVVPRAALENDWRAHKPTALWNRPCVGGYSGITVAGNLAVTLEQREEKEAIVCYDRATGAERWVYAYDAFHNDVMGNGPRSTPTIHNQRIFTLGATGELVCLNPKGDKQWQVNILDDSRAAKIKWGMSGSPLIVDDLVIAHAGIDPESPAGASLVAFEQATGKKRWAIGNRPAGYSSPQLVTLGKTRQILVFDGDGLVSYDIETQKELWTFPWKTIYDMNSIQPVILGDDRVFISSEQENGCALLRVAPPADSANAWHVQVVWKNKKLAARFANPVSDGKRIFALHGLRGELRCLSAADGGILWRGDDYGPGQMLLAGGRLLMVSEAGVVSLLDKDAAEAKELARHALLNPKTKTWNTPALAGDQLFVRNQAEIACLKLPLRR